MGVTVTKINESYCSIVWNGKDPQDPDHINPLLFLDNLFALHPEGYQFDPRYKKRQFTRYDGKIHLFNLTTGLLPLGLVKEALYNLKSYGFKLVYDDSLKNSFINHEYNKDFVDAYISRLNEETKMSLRDYQADIIHLASSRKRATLESATGSGKTLTVYFLLRFLLDTLKPEEKILIIVPDIGLVFQTYTAFKSEYKWDNIDSVLGMYNSDLPKDYLIESLKKRCLLSTWQSLIQIHKKRPEFFNGFKCVVVDEAHGGKSVSVKTIVNSCVNATYRIGLTGTIPKNKLDEKTIIGSIGPAIKVVDTKELQDSGILANCIVNKVELKYDNASIKFAKTGNSGNKISYLQECTLTRLNKSKEYTISKLIELGYISKEHNTLILASKISNGELPNMVAYLKQCHPEFEVLEIHGGIEATERERIRNYIETAKGVIVVATYKTMSTGINIKNLHNLCFMSSLKAYTTIIQSIGRVLRTHASKEQAQIFDIVDDIRVTNKSGKIFMGTLATHYNQRASYYKEKGFTVNTITMDKIFTLNPRDLLNVEADLDE